MIAAFLGVVLAIAARYFTGLGWQLVATFWVFALVTQVTYARSLNALLGRADPVATLGAKNLRQLRNIIQIPAWIVGLRFLAQVLGGAGLAVLLIWLGWLPLPSR